MLFLGAGASKAVKIGDLNDITERIVTRLTDAGYGELVQHIIDTLNNSGLFKERELDIEVIFSVLNGRVNHKNTMKALGPYAIYLDQLGPDKSRPLPFDSTLQNQRSLRKIRDIVEDEIIDSCLTYDRDTAQSYYDDLFEFAKRIRSNPDHQLLFHQIVTTNYDLVIERCSQLNSAIPSTTGFIQDQLTREFFLPLDQVILGYGSPNLSIQYLKLHGSINWWIRESDKRIVQRNERRASTTLMGETYSERLMIYPIYEKYVSIDPYFSLHYYFRRLLYFHNDYVVIGYSFRDQAINNAFADALRMNSKAKMVVVNKDAQSINQKVNEIFHDISDGRITQIQTAFGDNTLYDELANILT